MSILVLFVMLLCGLWVLSARRTVAETRMTTVEAVRCYDLLTLMDPYEAPDQFTMMRAALKLASEKFKADSEDLVQKYAAKFDAETQRAQNRIAL